uniref:hypothetical protein n=1 Tax=Helicobacter suis TaxID=104628 RepID=UPI003D30EFCD
ELINLASASNKERSTTFGDRLIAAIGKYDSHITSQNLKILSLETNDVEELALRVAKVLDRYVCEKCGERFIQNTQYT